MRRRLDFVIPDTETARRIEDELLLARIEERHMHFLAQDEATLGDLPKASLSHRMDLVHGMQRGLIVGLGMGTVVGLALYWLTDIGALLGLGAVLLFALSAAAMGAWISGMIGSSVANPWLKQFEQTLRQGHILLMVDVPVERVEEIEALIARHHPEVEDRGVEPTTPAFP